MIFRNALNKCLSLIFRSFLSLHIFELKKLCFCLRPKAKDLVITQNVVLGFFFWSMPYQIPLPCYPQFLKNIFNLSLVFVWSMPYQLPPPCYPHFLNILNLSIVVVLGFFIWSMLYQLPPPGYPQFFLNIFNDLSIYVFFYHLSINQSIYWSMYLSLYLSIYPSIHLAVYFSVNLSIDLFHSLHINI